MAWISRHCNKIDSNTLHDKIFSPSSRGFQASDIFNMDETELTTVQKPCKIMWRNGIKQICVAAVSATGNNIP